MLLGPARDRAGAGPGVQHQSAGRRPAEDVGDDALVLAQRLTQWVTAAPELEEEVAVANIALDLLGQARLLLARAASVGVRQVVTVADRGIREGILRSLMAADHADLARAQA